MIDLHVENGYPDHDTLSIDVFDVFQESAAGGDKALNITVSRDEHGDVHIVITDFQDDDEAVHVLGRPGVHRK